MAEMIEDLYSNHQIVQVAIGNSWLSCLLPSFGSLQLDNGSSFELEDKYFHDKHEENIQIPTCRLTWPCKIKHAEILAGEVYLNISLTLSSKTSLRTKEDIDSYIFQQTKNKSHISHTCVTKKLASKSSSDTTYFQFRPLSEDTHTQSFAIYAPRTSGVAVKFHFSFVGFSTARFKSEKSRDQLLEQICEEFMSHVELTPLPHNERPQIAEKPAATDGW